MSGLLLQQRYTQATNSEVLITYLTFVRRVENSQDALQLTNKGVQTQQEGTGQEDIGSGPANLRARRDTEQIRDLPESKRNCQTWRTQLCWSEMELIWWDVKSFSTGQAKDLTKRHVACCQTVRCEKKRRWTISLLGAVHSCVTELTVFSEHAEVCLC